MLAGFFSETWLLALLQTINVEDGGHRSGLFESAELVQRLVALRYIRAGLLARAASSTLGESAALLNGTLDAIDEKKVGVDKKVMQQLNLVAKRDIAELRGDSEMVQDLEAIGPLLRLRDVVDVEIAARKGAAGDAAPLADSATANGLAWAPVELVLFSHGLNGDGEREVTGDSAQDASNVLFQELRQATAFRKLADDAVMHAYAVASLHMRNCCFAEAQLWFARAQSLLSVHDVERGSGDWHVLEFWRALAARCEAHAFDAAPQRPALVDDSDFEALERHFVGLARVAAVNRIDTSVPLPEAPARPACALDATVRDLEVGNQYSRTPIHPLGSVVQLGLRSAGAAATCARLVHSPAHAHLALKHLRLTDLSDALRTGHRWLALRQCAADGQFGGDAAPVPLDALVRHTIQPLAACVALNRGGLFRYWNGLVSLEAARWENERKYSSF